ncbi:MAG: hypothetical protein ACRD19_15050 [Terriglobia bacterium]
MKFAWRCAHCNVHGVATLCGPLSEWLAKLSADHRTLAPHCDAGTARIVLIAAPEARL